MNNVVIAIEFDEELDDILAFTTELLKGKSATVHVVHVYQAHSNLIAYAPEFIDAIQPYEDYLQNQAESVRGVVKRLSSEGISAHGYMKPIEKNVADAILEFGAEKKADLMVLGTHHPKRVERMILGSVAEKIVRQSNVPVVVVPRKAKVG